MKKNGALFLLMAAVLGLGSWLVGSCREKTNIVTQTKPKADLSWYNDRSATLEELLKLPEEKRAAKLRELEPGLSRDIEKYLRERTNTLPPETNHVHIEYFFGSADKVRVENAHGAKNGFFENELIARVTPDGKSENAFAVIVRCLNGWIDWKDERLKSFQALGELPGDSGSSDGGSTVGIYLIQKGQGLVDITGELPDAFAIAKECEIPLYVDHYGGRRVDTEEALRLVDRGVRIVPGLWPGDKFHCSDGHCTYSPATGHKYKQIGTAWTQPGPFQAPKRPEN